MDLPTELYVKEVESAPDIVSFTYGFGLAPEGKASEVIHADSVVELDDGDLMIEGWAANFEGIDREGENFTDGAFKRGIKGFLAAGGPLCYHHDAKLGIGRVLDLEEVEGKGLRMRARVDKQEPASPLYHIYSAIKKGTYRGLSIGGFFKRKLTPSGWRINDMDFTEISVTPVPVHKGTSFAVVAGKALSMALPLPSPVDGDSSVIGTNSANFSVTTTGAAPVTTQDEEGKDIERLEEVKGQLEKLVEILEPTRSIGSETSDNTKVVTTT